MGNSSRSFVCKSDSPRQSVLTSAPSSGRVAVMRTRGGLTRYRSSRPNCQWLSPAARCPTSSNEGLCRLAAQANNPPWRAKRRATTTFEYLQRCMAASCQRATCVRISNYITSGMVACPIGSFFISGCPRGGGPPARPSSSRREPRHRSKACSPHRCAHFQRPNHCSNLTGLPAEGRT